MRTLAVKGAVSPGDILFTGRESYAKVHFTDGGEITLRPDTQFQIEKYAFDEKQPGKDGAEFSLLKGSLRALTGLISKRGNKDSYAMKTPVATIGIRGTEYGLQMCRSDCDHIKTAEGNKPPDGLMSQVDQGAIIERNKGGDLLVEVGGFSHVGNENSIPLRIAPEQAVRIEVPAHITKEWERSSPGRETKTCPAG